MPHEGGSFILLHEIQCSIASKYKSGMYGRLLNAERKWINTSIDNKPLLKEKAETRNKIVDDCTEYTK
jgi:hypothetical protein